MNSFQLTCNYHNCYQKLNEKAWVTTCSHIFCNDHGQVLSKQDNKSTVTCPACKIQLKKPYSVMQTKLLKPSKEFKAVVLMGLKPDDVLEIAVKAIDFWYYQMNEENRIFRKKMEYYKKELSNVETIVTEKLKAINRQLENEVIENQRLQMEIKRLRQKSIQMNQEESYEMEM